jgi:type I restriction enzyme, S subunit
MIKSHELPPDWFRVALGSVAQVIDPHPSHRAPDVVRDGVPFAGIGDLNEVGEIVGDSVRRVSSDVLKEHASRYTLSGNSIGFGRVASIGKVIDFPQSVSTIAISPTMAVIEPKSVDRNYLLQALRSNFVRAQIDRSLTGTTRSSLGIELLRKLSIPLPLNREPEQIGLILTTLDNAIRRTEALIAKYQQIKVGLMHDLFTRGVTANGHLRPTCAQASHLYKESPLGWIPKEWEVSKLRDKSSPVRPHIKTGPFGSSLKGEHWVENGHPVITIGALGEGELLTEGLLFVSEATAHRLREYQLQPGDVVFSRVADVGRSAVICEEHNGWIMSSNLMRISLNQNLIVPGYLQAQFAFDHRVKAQMRAKVNSGGRDVANGQILNQLQFAWPRHEEQHVALKRISALDANRRNVIDQQTKLLKLKQGLMHDLLTGRVRVKLGESVSA